MRWSPDPILELIPDPVIAFDAQRRIVYWSRAAEETYGFARRRAVGALPAALLRTRYPAPLLEIIEELTDTGRWSGRLVHRCKDGRELIVESTWAARYDDNRRLAGAVAIDRYITGEAQGEDEHRHPRATAERGRLQNQLERSQRLESLGQLAGGIAHDFNNLLGVIINYAAFVSGELTALESSTPHRRWRKMRDDVSEIETAAARAARLTHQLLAFSRQETNQPVAVDVNVVIASMEELLRRTLGEHVELVTSPGEDLPPVRADPGQLEQVLVNLAVNSRDAMPGGGTLTIDTAVVEVDETYAAPRAELSAGTYVRMRVSDTGTGMAPKVVEHAFDPFFTTKPIGQGTGLGLATVYGIVTQAFGRIQIYSEPSIGTTFSILLPATEATLEREPPPVEPSPEPPAHATILLVEDEDALREAARRTLAEGGYEVIAAASGAEALKAANAHPATIDLLLSDVIMPGMLGHQLAEQLRQARPALRVLYMSGFAEPVLGQTMHVDRADLVEKPFTAPALMARVRRALWSA